MIRIASLKSQSVRSYHYWKVERNELGHLQIRYMFISFEPFNSSTCVHSLKLGSSSNHPFQVGTASFRACRCMLPNMCVSKIMVPPNHPMFNWLFPYKPSILGYLYFWKHPYPLGIKKKPQLQMLIGGPYIMANGKATISQQSEFCVWRRKRRRGSGMLYKWPGDIL